MKRLILISVVLFLMIPFGLRAQLDPVSLALRAYQNKDLPKARELIEIAATDDNYNKAIKTWYFRGYIYKELYTANKDANTKETRSHRQEAIESFQKAIELEPSSELAQDSYKALNFLGATLYNDAAYMLDSFRFEDAQSYFDQYITINKYINPEANLTQRTLEFKKFKAAQYSMLFDSPRPGDDVDELSGKITSLYDEVLGIDSNDLLANYNLAIHYYNQGVNIIENMDYELDFTELFAIQEKVMDLFGSALPFMKKAYKLDPTRKETLVGLSGVYYGLNDLEKSEFYQNELRKLEDKENQ